MKHCDYCAQFIASPGRVLDVGSGKGKFLCEMARRGLKVHGVEVNPDYIEEAKSQAVKEGVAIQVINTQAESLPFPNDYFNFVNCAEVTEHVEYPVRVCEEIYRVLKPGGCGYISFHNRFGFYDYHYHLHFINWLPRSVAEFILFFLNKQKTDSIIGKQRLMTMHYFTYGQIKKILENSGFLVVDIREEKINKTYKYAAFPLLLVYYFFRSFYLNTFHILVKKSDGL